MSRALDHVASFCTSFRFLTGCPLPCQPQRHLYNAAGKRIWLEIMVFIDFHATVEKRLKFVKKSTPRLSFKKLSFKKKRVKKMDFLNLLGQSPTPISYFWWLNFVVFLIKFRVAFLLCAMGTLVLGICMGAPLSRHYLTMISSLSHHCLTIVPPLSHHYFTIISTLSHHYFTNISPLSHHYLTIIST